MRETAGCCFFFRTENCMYMQKSILQLTKEDTHHSEYPLIYAITSSFLSLQLLYPQPSLLPVQLFLALFLE